jgi:hypothetical protein
LLPTCACEASVATTAVGVAEVVPGVAVMEQLVLLKVMLSAMVALVADFMM